MSTRKANGSKIVSPTSEGRISPKAKNRKARGVSSAASDFVGAVRRGGRQVDVGKFVAPGAAVLASGAVAAIGYAFKEQIGDIFADALKGAITRSAKLTSAAGKGLETTREGAMDAVEKLADQVSLKTLLRHAGLQRRSRVGAILGPAVGVALGLVAGSALTFFFGPKLLEQFKGKAAPANDTTDKHEEGDSAYSPSDLDRPRANGGMHGGIS